VILAPNITENAVIMYNIEYMISVRTANELTITIQQEMLLLHVYQTIG